jgi:hypothetical protein
MNRGWVLLKAGERREKGGEKDKTLLFADRNVAKVQWYVKREVNTASCGAENALRSPPFGPSAGSGITSGSR